MSLLNFIAKRNSVFVLCYIFELCVMRTVVHSLRASQTFHRRQTTCLLQHSVPKNLSFTRRPDSSAWLVCLSTAPLPFHFQPSNHEGASWASNWKWINMYPLSLFKRPFTIHHSNTWQKQRKMSLWRFNYCREGERCLSLAGTNWMGYLQNKLVFEVLARPNRSEGGTR